MITHDYQLRFFGEDGDALAKAVPLSLGGALAAGVEALHWQSFLESGRGAVDAVAVRPRWSAKAGEPVVEAIVLEAGKSTVSLPVTRLFRSRAIRERARLLEQAALPDDARCRFLVTASPAAEASPLPVFPLADYPVSDRHLDPGGEAVDADFAAAGEFPVVIAPAVLAEAVRMAEAAGEAEAGGVLFGRLVRTHGHAGVALSITHLCPASGGRGESNSFTFTPETWTSAEAARVARASDELMVGSYHSHPDFCRNCPPERQAACKLREPFFSRDDEQLQQSVFPAAYSVGLLVSHDGHQRVPSLWGWREGFIERRAYFIQS